MERAMVERPMVACRLVDRMHYGRLGGWAKKIEVGHFKLRKDFRWLRLSGGEIHVQCLNISEYELVDDRFGCRCR